MDRLMVFLRSWRCLAYFIGVLLLGGAVVQGAAAAIINEPMTGATAPGWVLGGSAYLTASAGVDLPGDGWLRLTSVANNQAGYGFLDTSFDITQGAVIQFDYATWGGAGDSGGGCGTTGADGYSIFLFDGSVSAASFSVGASGGSLGYAQKTVAPVDPGLTGGYVGVGIDEWGNFSNPTEGRVAGPGLRCNGVAVRGPTANDPTGATGYAYVGGTATNVGQLAFPGVSSRPGQTGTDYRKVIIYLTPQPAPNYLRVDVYVQFGYNQFYTQVLNGLMVGQPPPALVKIGYAASTGGSTNYHEIRNLVVDPLPNSNIDLGIAKTVSASTVTQGSALTYTITARNYGPNNVTATNVPIVDTLPTEITGSTWTCVAAGGATCGASSGTGNINTTATLPLNSDVTYTVTGTVNASTPLGTQVINTASLTVPSGINDYVSSNNSSSATTTVVGTGINISGSIFQDNGAGGGTPYNGVRDGGETLVTGAGTYYAKIYRSSDLTTALQAVNTSATGTFTFTNIPSYDNYTIILSTTNTLTTFDPSFPSANWIYTVPSNYTLTNVAAGNTDLTGQNLGLYNGSRIDGQVIRDDGDNGSIATANDGVLNAAEVGIAGVSVSLRNNTGGTTYSSTTTDSNGKFALYTNVGSSTLRIYEDANPAGYLSVNYNAGTTGGTYTIGGEYIQFVYTRYIDYSGVIFSDVPNGTFTPTPQSGSAPIGSSTFLAHVFTPASGGSISFATNSRTQGTWPAVAYYLDADCSGTYTAGDTLISAPIDALKGTNVCILVNENVSSTATVGATDQIVTRATFTYTNSVGPVAATNDVTDNVTVIAGSDLSTSTKTWQDLNGGSLNPGDVLRYTITLKETGGLAASGVSVTDDIPVDLHGLSVVGIPTGAVNSSTYAGTGMYGNGYLNITGITVPANGSVTVVFDVTVNTSVPDGTVLTNRATVINTSGAGATPSVAATVSNPYSPITGNKYLYLYDTAPYQLSRVRPTALTGTVPINAGASLAWDLSPVLASNVTTISGSPVTVNLYLSDNWTRARTRAFEVRLACSSTPTVYATSGPQAPTLPPSGAPTLFSIPLTGNLPMTCTAGNRWQLTVLNQDTRGIIVYPMSGTANSYVDLPSQNVINVDNVSFYSAASPGGVPVSTASPGQPLSIRATVSDPFGFADITAARVTLTGPGPTTLGPYAMTELAGASGGVKNYEYLFNPLSTTLPTGTWSVNVVADEGTEGMVSSSATIPLIIAPFTGANLSTSTKTWQDLNGGSLMPADVMRYTITLKETGGVNATGVTVTDNIPADVNSFSVISIPTGAVDSSTGNTTGNYGNGYLNITGITVPANGSVTIVFDVKVNNGVANGTVITNQATITATGGLGAAPAVQATVTNPYAPITGNKYLYLYDTAPYQLSRVKPIGLANAVTINAGVSEVWTLSPTLASNVTTISGSTITADLYLANTSTRSRNRSFEVQMACSSAPTVVATSNVQTQRLPAAGSPQLFKITVSGNLPMTCTTGNSWVLTVINQDTRGIIVYPMSGAANSFVELPSQHVINVDSVSFYSGAAPGGAAVSTATVGYPFSIRATVSDPFGFADITAARVTLTGPGPTTLGPYAMTELAGAVGGVKNYEYLFNPLASSTPTGSWTVQVAADEGTEGMVTHTVTLPLTVHTVPVLTILRSASSSTVNPGAVVTYTLQVTNTGAGPAYNVMLTEHKGIYTDFGVDSYGTGIPFHFVDGTTASGVTLGTPEYSNDNGTTWTYVPTSGGGGAPAGFDANVTNWRITMSGALNTSPANFFIYDKVRVK